ncbi:MAG: PIG-L family deacetylase [bacterium]|nr:PIG-L family deacetylase [bacterium]
MMKILYVYPHPDDESFGPARAMAKQRHQGHEVHLLTLTKGGATKQRFKYGYSIEEMGEIRFKEMLAVADTLNLSGMVVLDMPDSGLKEMDPREIENTIIDEIERIQPQVVVTYAVHGISGFHDHLISHAVVKRAFVQLKEKSPWLKRLAFHTLTEETAKKSPHFKLNSSTQDEIDCVFHVDPIDIEKNLDALDCYETFKETIEKSGIKNFVQSPEIAFEIYRENHTPPLKDLFEGL